MKLNLVISFVLFFAIITNAQLKDAIGLRADSLRTQLSKDSARIFRKTLAKPYFKFENSVSLWSKDQIDLFGFLAGATFLQKHSVSLGYYFLDPYNQDQIVQNDNTITINHYKELHYYVLGYQYVLFNFRYFLVNIPLAVGYGQCVVDVQDQQTNVTTTESGAILPTNVGLQLVLKPIRWFGLSATYGYRNVAAQESTGLILRGPYYSLGIWMDARHINRSLRYIRKKHIYRREIGKLSAY